MPVFTINSSQQVYTGLLLEKTHFVFANLIHDWIYVKLLWSIPMLSLKDQERRNHSRGWYCSLQSKKTLMLQSAIHPTFKMHCSRCKKFDHNSDYRGRWVIILKSSLSNCFCHQESCSVHSLMQENWSHIPPRVSPVGFIGMLSMSWCGPVDISSCFLK